MITDYEIGRNRSIRHDRKRRRLGVRDPKCFQCGKEDFRYLCTPEVSLKNKLTAEMRCLNCIRKSRRMSWLQQSKRRKKIASAGYMQPACLNCGEDDIATLELHHPGAEANCSLVVPLCENCHAIESDKWLDFPLDLRRHDPSRRPLQFQAAFQFGLGVLLIAFAKACEKKQGGLVGCVFFGGAAILLVKWGRWNVLCDVHLVETNGEDYAGPLKAAVPK